MPNSLPEPSQYIPAEREEQEHVERDWMQEQGDREPPRLWDRDEAYMQGERDIDPTQRKRKPKNLNASGSQRNSMSNSMSLNTPGSHRASTSLNASETRHNSSGLTVTGRKQQTSASNAGLNAPDALDASHAGAEGALAYGTHRVAYDATQRVTEGDVFGAAPSQQKKRRKCKGAEEAMWEHRRGGIDVTREVGGMLGVDGAGVGAELVQQGGTGIQIQAGRGKMNKSKSNHQSLHQYVKTWTKETSVAKMSMGCAEQGGGLARSFSPNPYAGFGDAGRGDVGIGGVVSSDGGGSSDGAVVSSNRYLGVLCILSLGCSIVKTLHSMHTTLLHCMHTIFLRPIIPFLSSLRLFYLPPCPALSPSFLLLPSRAFFFLAPCALPSSFFFFSPSRC